MKTVTLSISAMCISALLLGISTGASAQEGSDIYLGKLNVWHKNPVTDIVRLTDTEGYTNQPYFFNNRHLYFTQALIQGEQSQTDIFSFQLSDSSTINITNSAESEYSPTPLPNEAGMSVIKVNAEGKQELWALDAEGKPLQHLAPTVEPVGYQVWLNDEELLLFVLGEPNTLQRVNIDSTKATSIVIDENIGASLAQFERSNWFLYSQGTDAPLLKAYNAKSGDTIDITALPQGSQYFSVSTTGHVITSDGKTLYHRQLIVKGDAVRAEGSWKSINIEVEACQSGISRTAISHFGDKIALVCPR